MIVVATRAFLSSKPCCIVNYDYNKFALRVSRPYFDRHLECVRASTRKGRWKNLMIIIIWKLNLLLWILQPDLVFKKLPQKQRESSIYYEFFRLHKGGGYIINTEL